MYSFVGPVDGSYEYLAIKNGKFLGYMSKQGLCAVE
jgi:hypothetical protein